MITREQKKIYLEDDGGVCPFCRSTDIEAIGSPEFDGGSCIQRITCNECLKEWYDVFALTDIIEIING